MKKFENFKAALVNLNDIFSYKEPYGNVEIAGMVGLYEICFEQSWKAMKELLENFGYAEGATGSPRTILKTAYKAGMISDEELWLDALVSRNNVAHAYNQAIAMDIICQTKEKYYDMFIQLEKKIEQDWLQQSISQVKFFYGLFTGCINTIAGINCIYAGEGCWYFETEDKKYSLVIPNKEIKEVFKLHIQEWFRNKIFSNTDQLQDFWKAFKDGKESSYHKGENNYGKENFSSSGRTE